MKAGRTKISSHFSKRAGDRYAATSIGRIRQAQRSWSKPSLSGVHPLYRIIGRECFGNLHQPAGQQKYTGLLS
jgi:hypothetical protein